MHPLNHQYCHKTINIERTSVLKKNRSATSLPWHVPLWSNPREAAIVEQRGAWSGIQTSVDNFWSSHRRCNGQSTTESALSKVVCRKDPALLEQLIDQSLLNVLLGFLMPRSRCHQTAYSVDESRYKHGIWWISINSRKNWYVQNENSQRNWPQRSMILQPIWTLPQRRTLVLHNLSLLDYGEYTWSFTQMWSIHYSSNVLGDIPSRLLRVITQVKVICI